jgi:hypothetical protein
VGSERDQKVFYENQSIRDFFAFESSFQNYIWNLFSTSGLPQISKIRNVWKLHIRLLGIRVILENGLGSFQTILISQISDKPVVLKRIHKQF